MSKVSALLTIALLLFFTVTSAVRPEPTVVRDFAGKLLSQGVEAVKNEGMVGESCGRMKGMYGCLKKRTLAADFDYIYSTEL